MLNRLKQFSKDIKQKGLDAFIVTNPINIFYLSGFRGISPTEREAILIVRSPKTYLITARLYQNEANALKSPRLDIKIAQERNEIFKFIEDLLKNCHRVGFEETSLTFSEYKNIIKLTSAKLLPFRDLVETQRVFKTEDEIKKIEKAQVISQKAFGQIVKTIKVGQTEEEIAETLAKIIKGLGGNGLSFESIIASGQNSGLPHYLTANRRLTISDTLLLDFGAKYQNYCADLSRTVFIGKTKDQKRNVFYHVLNAQKKAIEGIISGTKTHEAHNIAHQVFKDYNLHDNFLHGLGHGIGLEVHEKPHLHPAPLLPSKIKPQREESLLENMVFSVEPGLYFPWGGVRLEDLVTIKNGKAKVLGKTQTEIIEI